MTPPVPIRQLNPDDRYWRIDWFGEVEYQPGRQSQPCVCVEMSPVLCDPGDQNALLAATASDHNNQKRTWLPIGVMYLIRIGDIWHNGQCVNSPNYQNETFKNLDVAKETTDFIKAGLSLEGKFLLPLNEHPWHRLQTQSYCLSVVLPDEKRIIIPCVELIRFYFGSSSKLLHLLFTEMISTDHFWKSKNFDVSTGHLHLKLAAGISGMSATDIGRMALDPNAWQAARLIFHTCMSASVQRETVYPYTGFPFIGKTDLVATGKWLSSGDRSDATFVVYSLKTCSHPFPFNSLTYEVADSQKIGVKKNSSTNNGQENQQQKSIIKSSPSKSQTLADGDPGKSLSSKEHWAEGNPRFPDLTNKYVSRERYDTNDPPALLMLKAEAKDDQVSVGEGNSRNEKTRGINIGQGHVYTKLSEIDPKQHKFVLDGINLAYAQAKLQAETTTTELITLPGYSHPVISLPHLIDESGEINSISFCSDGYGDQRVRRGCFVEINRSEKTHHRVFIVEREKLQSAVQAINVKDFDLKRAMEGLIEKSKLLVNKNDVYDF